MQSAPVQQPRPPIDFDRYRLAARAERARARRTAVRALWSWLTRRDQTAGAKVVTNLEAHPCHS
jgi:hypothetical protein